MYKKRKRKEILNIINNLTDEVNFLDQIYYINLKHRTDRKESILKQIKLVDPEFRKTKRIEAIKDNCGAIGCGKSHILALEDAEKNNYDRVLILEDDFMFNMKIQVFKYIYNQLLEVDSDYNMFMVSKNLRRGKIIKENIVEVYEAQTNSGYIIQKKFFKNLRKNFEEAVLKLEDTKNQNLFAIDQYSKKLQGPGRKIYTSNVKLGYQKPDHSDIENKKVNYGV